MKEHFVAGRPSKNSMFIDQKVQLSTYEMNALRYAGSYVVIRS